MLKNHVSILAITLVTAACTTDAKPEPVSNQEINYLNYSLPSVDDSHGSPPITACSFAGANEQIVLVELQSAPQHSGLPQCGDNIRKPVATIGAHVVNTIAGSTAAELTALSMYDSNVVQVEGALGDLQLWSVRQVGEEWFVMNWLAVDELTAPPADPDPDRPVQLPFAWDELVQLLSDARTDRSACDDGDIWDGGVDLHKQMSEEEFDTWVHTDAPYVCDNPAEPNEHGDVGQSDVD